MDHQSPVSFTSNRTVFKNAYEALAAEIAAVPTEQLRPINVDVDAAVITVRGAMPEILALREVMQRDLPQFDLSILDKLESYALALFHLNAQHRMATAPSLELPALVEQATAMRDMFVADAQALAKRGLLDAAAVEGRPQGKGYKPLVVELYAVMDLLRGSWSRIAGRSGVRPEEFAEAESLADRLSLALGLREQGPAENSNVSALGLERQRAFALFVTKYDQVRRATAYLRWDQGDCDSIAPSIYAGRNNGGRRSNDAGASEVATAGRGVQAGSPNVGNAPAAAAGTGTASSAGFVSGYPSMPALMPGAPGSDPFGPA